MKNMLRTFLCWVWVMGSLMLTSLQAQVTVTSASPYNQYARNLVGNGIDIVNVRVECDTLLTNNGNDGVVAIGQFDATTSPIQGLPSGTIMSTGHVGDFAQPATAFASSATSGPGFPLLDQLFNANTDNSCAIIFDIIPYCDTISISYVFGSEEYPEFAPPISSLYNDVFAFFINGPGFAPNTNIATLPGTTTPVSINNINAVTNQQFYVDNQTGTQFVLDGHTVALEAIAAVQPCQQYTLTLVIADDFDNIWDSAVLLEAGGIACRSGILPTLVAGNFNNPTSPIGIEGCVDAYVDFTNNNDTTESFTINYTIGGTATNGVDYQLIPDSVVIPAGQSTVRLPINIVNDGINEGTEFIQFVIADSSCRGLLQDTLRVEIQDPFQADAGVDKIVCSGETGQVGLPAQPGHSYQWSSPNGLGWSGTPNPTTALGNVELTNGTNNIIQLAYFLRETDENGCIDRDTVRVSFTPKPITNFTVDDSICTDESATVLVAGNRPAGAVYTWDYGGGTGTTTGPGPHLVTWTTGGTKQITLVANVNGCDSDPVTKNVVVSEIPASTFSIAPDVCAGGQASVNYLGGATPANSTFNWNLDGGNGAGGAGPFGVTWTVPGPKTVTLTVEENGCLSPPTSQDITVKPVPSPDFALTPAVCQGEDVQIGYTGSGTGAASYAWNFDGGVVSSGNGSGPYVLSWPQGGTRTVCLTVEQDGCISALNCQPITVHTTPQAGISAVSNQCFPGNSFQFSSTGDADVENWFWTFGADAVPAQSQAATPPAVTYQTPGRKTVSLVVQRNGCLSDTAQVSFEVVPEPSADFTVSSQTTCQSGCLDFAYSGISQGPNQTYQWDFGVGAVPSTTSLPSLACVRYGSAGTKDVSLTVNFRGCVVSTTQQVEVYPNPTADAGALVEYCEGSGGAQINATIDEGVQPYFFQWTCEDAPNCGLSDPYTEDPIANPDLVVATDTILYYLEATDFNGCSSGRDSVRVVVKAQPKLDAGPDVAICEEGPGAFLEAKPSAANTAPLPFQYFWTPVEGLGNNTGPRVFARPDTTTIYTVRAFSSNGCASEVTTLDTLSTVTVRVNPLPVAEAGADTALCEEESIVLQGSASEAGPQYSYSWTPATTGTILGANTATPRITPLFTTTYTLVVSSNGCDSRGDSVEVIVDTRPTPTAGADRTFCQGDTLRLFGGASGDPGATFYRYQWSPAIGFVDEVTAAQPRLVADATREYILQATSPFGCGSGTDTVLVTVKPTPIVRALQADTVICQGDTLPLSAVHSFTTPPGRPVTYRWLPVSSVVGSPALPDVRVLPQATTRYVVEASIAGDCPTTDAVLVTVSPKVEAGIEADTTRLCAGTSVQLVALGSRGNASFSWLPAVGLSDPSSERPVATPDTTTTYQVLVTEGVCADTATVTLVVNPTPGADYFSSQPAGCEGLEVHFIANSADATSYVWDFGDGSPLSNAPNPSHVYGEAGEYPVSLTVVGAGGCESTATLTTVRISASSAAAFTASPGPGEELNLPEAAVQFTDQSQAAVRWFWDFGDGATGTVQNPGHTYAEAGTYTVNLTVTDENGCVSTVSEGPFTVAADNLLIPNVFTPNEDGTNDVYTVRYNGTEVFSLQVYDRWGRSFFESDAAQDGWDGLDPEGQPAKEGVYFYLVRIGDQEYNGNLTLLR